MEASTFWEVIGLYNQKTIAIQLVLLAFFVCGVLITVFTKKGWILKLILGVLNLFICIGFFAMYGVEPIQKYFAFPLYLFTGILFFYDAVKNRQDEIQRPNTMQMILIVLYVLYPVISMVLGARFPQMVTHIMPCPVVTISIALYSCYKKKNLILLSLLTLWGLTGVKSVIFAAYEDIILLVAGIYGVILLVNEVKKCKVEM